MWDPCRPKRHQHRERKEEEASGGGGDTEARQEKSEVGDVTPDLVLKHPDATLATYV
jgi:hypothetical protein